MKNIFIFPYISSGCHRDQYLIEFHSSSQPIQNLSIIFSIQGLVPKDIIKDTKFSIRTHQGQPQTIVRPEAHGGKHSQAESSSRLLLIK